MRSRPRLEMPFWRVVEVFDTDRENKKEIKPKMMKSMNTYFPNEKKQIEEPTKDANIGLGEERLKIFLLYPSCK